ncbi:hypothetical protein GQ53DRAFT_233599 [Thozetella sp. PMI_491]|nr:hypothetical protein GQ53DRAFT_233599 [Thozetella sp. PMI_491]
MRHDDTSCSIMPATNRQPHARWDNWPPTQMRLQPNLEHDDAEIEEFDLAMDQNPINFFLTPATPSYEVDLDMMDFDAGIEDSKHPAPIVRSVSPSSLEGLRLPPPRPPTPPKSPSTPDLDIEMGSTPEDDDEDYIHFLGYRAAIPDIPSYGKNIGKFKGGETEAYSTSHHVSATADRGRAVSRPGPRSLAFPGSLRSRPRSWSSRQASHSWREPSPDVWSIEEEAEEEAKSDMSESAIEEGHKGRVVRATAIDVPAAKPKKKVRFVLPAREESD